MCNFEDTDMFEEEQSFLDHVSSALGRQEHNTRNINASTSNCLPTEPTELYLLTMGSEGKIDIPYCSEKTKTLNPHNHHLFDSRNNSLSNIAKTKTNENQESVFRLLNDNS